MFEKFFDYLEEREYKNITLPSLKDIKNVNKTKHDIEFTLVNQLNDFSDIAKYVAIALSFNYYKPFWTKDEILDFIKSGEGIADKYKDYMKHDQGKTDLEKKKIAKEIWKDILEKEVADRSEIIKKLDSNLKPNEMPFAHELVNDGRLVTLEKSIITALKLLIKVSDSYDKYEFDINDYLNYEKEGSMSTKSFMNSLIKKLSLQISIIKHKFEFDEKIELILSNVSDDLNQIEGVLWPESDKNISTIESLQKYFGSLKTKGEKKRAEKIEKKYKKNKHKYDDADFKKVLMKTYKGIKDESSSIEPEKFEKILKKTSRDLLKHHKWLFDYIKKEFLDDDDEVTKDEVEDELSSRLAYYHKKLSRIRGQK